MLDFFPDVPASHAWHIFCNAHNAILTQHLNVVPDWDMFQTLHPWASYHAAARCLSGGPVSITDKPGKHDVDLIRQMTAWTINGQMITLRPDTVCKSTQAYTSYDQEALLKIGTYVGKQGTGTGILGGFNGTGSVLTEFIRFDEFPGVVVGEEYIVRAHTSGHISPTLILLDQSLLLFLTLPVKGWEILSAYRLWSFCRSPPTNETVEGGCTLQLANLGLLGKMTGAAAVLRTDYSTARNDRVVMTTSLKALGILGRSYSFYYRLSLKILPSRGPFILLLLDDCRLY